MGEVLPFTARRPSYQGAPLPASRAALRREVEDQIEALIAFLDLIDGDADGREPDEDCEPSLGWTLHGGWGATRDLEDTSPEPFAG